MATQNVTVYIYYANQGADGDVKIVYCTDAACTQTFVPATIAPGDSVNYTLLPGTPTFSFDFVAITFWAKDENGRVASEVARTFQKFKDGVANFDGRPYVTNVDCHSKSSISFTLTNCNPAGVKGFVSFQTTLEDKKRSALFTSMDPQIGLDKPPGATSN